MVNEVAAENGIQHISLGSAGGRRAPEMGVNVRKGVGIPIFREGGRKLAVFLTYSQTVFSLRS